MGYDGWKCNDKSEIGDAGGCIHCGLPVLNYRGFHLENTEGGVAWGSCGEEPENYAATFPIARDEIDRQIAYEQKAFRSWERRILAREDV